MHKLAQPLATTSWLLNKLLRIYELPSFLVAWIKSIPLRFLARNTWAHRPLSPSIIFYPNFARRALFMQLLFLMPNPQQFLSWHIISHLTRDILLWFFVIPKEVFRSTNQFSLQPVWKVSLIALLNQYHTIKGSRFSTDLFHVNLWWAFNKMITCKY